MATLTFLLGVIPAKAGTQEPLSMMPDLGARFRGHDNPYAIALGDIRGWLVRS